jgi:hypothetical protein
MCDLEVMTVLLTIRRWARIGKERIEMIDEVLVVGLGDKGGNPTLHLEHNYAKKLVLMRQAGLLSPGIQEMKIQHDDWCSFLKGGRCNCDPQIIFSAAPTGRR